MQKNLKKGFTILELLVVVAIIAILAVIALPNFIGRIEEAKDSQELAEINAVDKAISMYYADFGNYPTLQGKDGTLLQLQPLDGSPHNIDFSSLVPNYLATLPHFSYWWVDYQGKVYHTQNTIGAVASGIFTPTAEYSYTLYKTNGTTQVLSAPYTLLAGEYIVGKDDNGSELPKISSVFKNAKVHPESGEAPAVAVALYTHTFTNASATGRSGPTQAQVTSAYASTALAGKVTVIGSGTQVWTVPDTGTYRIEAYGAQGGYSSARVSVGGKGAIIRGDVALVAGDVLRILVGQSATTSIGGGTVGLGGAGGGGTFVTKVSASGYAMFDGVKVVPLVIAGGGGGANYEQATYDVALQMDGQIGTSGGSSTGNAGGVDGAGGGFSAGADGGRTGGGGGFLSHGASISLNGNSSQGLSFLSGGAGGIVATYSPNLIGGFGGGGANTYNGGAGGGYSGGRGGTATPYAGGGGGGSYNIGTNQSNTVGNTGMGKVVITYYGP